MNILQSRLANQLLLEDMPKVAPYFHQTPHAVVKHLTCIQSQDLTQAKRAIASRCGCAEQDVIDAFNRGEIIRTWTQRGTIHTVATQDAGRIVRLCASKTLNGFARRRNHLGISDEISERSLQLLREMLSGGKALTRDQIAENFKLNGIELQNSRKYHLLCYAGTLGMIVQGPIIDGNHAFVLYEERAKTKNNYTDVDAVRELCLRYFTSHGPATVEDFARWSGLGKTEIKQGIVLCGDALHAEQIEGRMYYLGISSFYNDPPIPLAKGAYANFLAGFDEFLLGYKDRTAMLEMDHHTLVDVSRNGVFKPTVMIDGRTIATWSVKHKSKVSEITVKPFIVLADSEQAVLQKASQNYAQYIAKAVALTIG